MDDRHFDKIAAMEWIKTIEGENGLIRESDLYPHLREWVERVNPQKIIDIGCGQGICSANIDLTGRNYFGIDPSPFLLERAMLLHTEPNKFFSPGNAYELPFSDCSFDAAFSIAVWHLLEDKPKAAREMSRVVKQGGHFMIVAANPATYDEWIKTYSSGTQHGYRFEGQMRHDDGSESTDVLYLHSLDEIIASLQLADFEIESKTAFRTAISIQGKKRVKNLSSLG